MEEIRRIDPDAYNILKANQFNDASLMLLSEGRLKNIGLKEGPLVLVLDVIERTKTKNVLVPSNSNVLMNNPNSELRKKLEENPKFAQAVLYRKLDKGLELERKDRCELVRILCADWSKRVFTKSYPTTIEQKKMARDIIEAFPYLANTEYSNEAAFFNPNSGKGANFPHSGTIYNHFRNLCHKIPSESKKFPRPTKKDFVTDEVIEISQFLARMEENPDNRTYVKEYMVKCLPLLNTMLKQKKSPKSMVEAFPHLAGYNGEIILLMFDQIKSNANKHANFSNMCLKGLLYKPKSFCRIEDDNLRGLLRIWLHLNFQGIKRKAREGDDLEEQLVSSLIKWVGEDEIVLQEHLAQVELDFIRRNTYPSGHILCRATKFSIGQYYIYIGGVLIKINGDFIKA
ncbi:uncharacterized protein LOC129752954 [Uranotaenia lowii]|uniref:uncharacterized protein LOC129752954 n=1 Tax=Uranotaenia lowii TaxID=190385 RepID=UPI002479026D|nr:uncharacterized protein LOC129752954 [Uranotaenia lowii]